MQLRNWSDSLKFCSESLAAAAVAEDADAAKYSLCSCENTDFYHARLGFSSTSQMLRVFASVLKTCDRMRCPW